MSAGPPVVSTIHAMQRNAKQGAHLKQERNQNSANECEGDGLNGKLCSSNKEPPPSLSLLLRTFERISGPLFKAVLLSRSACNLSRLAANRCSANVCFDDSSGEFGRAAVLTDTGVAGFFSGVGYAPPF